MKSLQELINKHGDQEISEEKFMETFGIEVKKRWKPDGGLYWYVSDNGVVLYTYWRNRLDDRCRWGMGNVYKTEEEAQFASDKKRFLVKMERDFEDNSKPIDWKNKDQKKYSIYLHHYSQELAIDRTLGYQTLEFFTTNEEWLRQYIKDNEANIKKFVFGIES